MVKAEGFKISVWPLGWVCKNFEIRLFSFHLKSLLVVQKCKFIISSTLFFKHALHTDCIMFSEAPFKTFKTCHPVKEN